MRPGARPPPPRQGPYSSWFSRPTLLIVHSRHPEVLCFDTDSNGSLANPLLSDRFPKPGGRGGTPPNRPVSFFQEIFPEKPHRRQKNDVKRNQERQPIPTQHRLLREERGRRLRTGDEQRRQQRQQKQWQQQFAHARLRGNRRQRRPRDGKPEATQE